MFRLAKKCFQIIVEIELPESARTAYLKAKEANPEDVFVLSTIDPIDPSQRSWLEKPFKAWIKKRGPNASVLADLVEANAPRELQRRTLQFSYHPREYVSNFVFYLYGTPHSLNIEHIIIKCPNIQLSAENIELHGITVTAEDLEQGSFVMLEGLSQRAMQPFQSSPGASGDALLDNPTFFFRSGQEFQVSVYRGESETMTSPTHLNMDKQHLIGRGTMKFPPNMRRYVDSIELNADPYEVKDGTEKYKAWKAVFDSIGKELD